MISGTKCVQAGYTLENGQSVADSDHPVYLTLQIQHQWVTWKNCLILRHPDILYTAAESDEWSCRKLKIAVQWKAAQLQCWLKRTGSGTFCHIQHMWVRPYRGIILDLRRNSSTSLQLRLPKWGSRQPVSPDASEEELNAAFRPNTNWCLARRSPIRHCSIRYWAFAKNGACAWCVPLHHRQYISNSGQLQTIEWGADIVTHSTTKYMDGHGAAVGGAIATAENLTGWHTQTNIRDFVHRMRATMRDLCRKIWQWGRIHHKNVQHSLCVILMHPVARMHSLLNLDWSHRMCVCLGMWKTDSSCRISGKHPKVAYVNYPPAFQQILWTCQKYLPHGGCGVVSFGLKGGRETASAFMQNLKAWTIEHMWQMQEPAVWIHGKLHAQTDDRWI